MGDGADRRFGELPLAQTVEAAESSPRMAANRFGLSRIG
jgi:hypothetical protein